VKELRKNLRAFGAECFLDTRDIGLGTSWRRQLHQKMANSNVFISVTDEVSIRKEWPAAEMETALASKSVSELPEIIMLVKPGLKRETAKANMPVFNSIFQSRRRVAMDPVRIIEVKQDTIFTLASGFKRDHYYTAGVLPGLISNWYKLLIVKQLCILGSIGSFLGGILLIAAATHLFGLMDLSWFSSHSIGQFVYIAFGFWLGFTLRLAIGSRYEVQYNETDSKGLEKLNYVAFLGFAATLGFSGIGMPDIYIAWAAIAFSIGFFNARDFLGSFMQRAKYQSVR
jgi:hypothetical protein